MKSGRKQAVMNVTQAVNNAARTILILGLLAWGQGSCLARADSLEGNSCISCHEDYWGEMKNSIHSQHGVYCNDCHGGDASKSDEAAAKDAAAGFIGVPDKKTLVEMCGSCHADVETMNFYGIRTDQLARYKTSRHGKKLFQEGDDNVAGCSDCHGYHDVLKVGDPASPVYPLNLPKTCNHCHGNEKLMSKYGLPSDVFDKYASSVHGQALFEKGDLSAAHCARCHGSHGAVPPGVKDISTTCGKCHLNEEKYFLDSVHAGIAQKGKFSQCVSCHGHHAITHADPSLYASACQKCHESGGTAMETGDKIAGMLALSVKKLDSAEKMISRAGIEGIYVEEEEGLLEKARTHAVSMAPRQHSLLINEISEIYEKFEEITGDIEKKIRLKKQHLKWRRGALVPIWIFIIIMMTALWKKYKLLKREKEEKSDGTNG